LMLTRRMRSRNIKRNRRRKRGIGMKKIGNMRTQQKLMMTATTTTRGLGRRNRRKRWIME